MDGTVTFIQVNRCSFWPSVRAIYIYITSRRKGSNALLTYCLTVWIRPWKVYWWVFICNSLYVNDSPPLLLLLLHVMVIVNTTIATTIAATTITTTYTTTTRIQQQQ